MSRATSKASAPHIMQTNASFTHFDLALIIVENSRNRLKTTCDSKDSFKDKYPRNAHQCVLPRSHKCQNPDPAALQA